MTLNEQIQDYNKNTEGTWFNSHFKLVKVRKPFSGEDKLRWYYRKHRWNKLKPVGDFFDTMDEAFKWYIDLWHFLQNNKSFVRFMLNLYTI